MVYFDIPFERKIHFFLTKSESLMVEFTSECLTLYTVGFPAFIFHIALRWHKVFCLVKLIII